jgi:hypothetical protein
MKEGKADRSGQSQAGNGIKLVKEIGENVSSARK